MENFGEPKVKRENMNYPKKVTVGDITIRDGFQHEEKYISADAKLWLAKN